MVKMVVLLFAVCWVHEVLIASGVASHLNLEDLQQVSVCFPCSSTAAPRGLCVRVHAGVWRQIVQWGRWAIEVFSLFLALSGSLSLTLTLCNSLKSLSRLTPLPNTHTLLQWKWYNLAPFNTDANRRVLGNAFKWDDRWRDTWWPAYRMTPIFMPSPLLSLFVFAGRVRPPNLPLILLKTPQKGISEQSSGVVIWRGVPFALCFFPLFSFFPEGSVSSDYSIFFLQN